jgi:hypothetical protein
MSQCIGFCSCSLTEPTSLTMGRGSWQTIVGANDAPIDDQGDDMFHGESSLAQSPTAGHARFHRQASDLEKPPETDPVATAQSETPLP